MKPILLWLVACVAPAQSVNVAFVGDSYTWGYHPPSGYSTRQWPTLVVPMLHPRQYNAAVNNWAINGQPLGNAATDGTGEPMFWCATHTCTRALISGNQFPGPLDNLIAVGKINILVVMAGQIDRNAGTSAADVYANLKTYYTTRKAAGWNKIIACSLIPDAATNALLRADHGDADVFLDAIALAPFTEAWGGTYRYSDGHWQDALNNYMAMLVAGKINGLTGGGWVSSPSLNSVNGAR